MTTNGHYPQTRWTLEALFPASDSPAIEQAVQAIEEKAEAIEALRPQLSPDMSGEDFAKALQLIEQFNELMSRLGSYGQLWFTEDTQNQDALAMMGRMEQLLTEAGNRILFFRLWWRSLDDDAAQRLLDYAGDARYSFEQDRLFKDYTLSEAEEKIINIKDVNGVNALTTLYDMITNKFTFNLTVDGEPKELTRGELMTYVRDPNPDLRQGAYEELYRVYSQEASTLSQIYIHTVRDWASENIKLRGIESPISVRNLVNDIPDSVVDTLLDVCAEQGPIFQRYFQLKAGWLNSPNGKLRRYDLYAPLNQSSGKKIAYGDAVDLVLESLHNFSPLVADHARRVFDDNHIDSEVRPRKRGGAFCAGILPGITPWVLINYTGEPREVATLAHELGHAIHAMLASDHSVLTFHSALPLAETASVFSEMLLTDRLLAEESNPEIRRDLLVEAIDDAYATVLRQAYFVMFERDAHRMIAEGSTTDQLNQLYLNNLKQQFGDALDVSEDFQYEWIVIPHIYHTPFYCYAYSFGQLLSLSLYQQYKNQGDAFKPALLKILAYGGSASPNHILSEVGIDMADPNFWRGGFKFVEGMINELEKIHV
ncbi:MAG: M3 family oligoendopeptidase [Anaerolineae bacterium]|nr:M3 family oligoendopeptidase [Anaerolineae bacterium]